MSLSRFDFDDLWRLRLDAFGGARGGSAGEGDAPAWELVDDGARGLLIALHRQLDVDRDGRVSEQDMSVALTPASKKADARQEL